MSNISMSYGSYDFEPIPTVTINKAYIRNGAKEIIGQRFTLTLNGFITTKGASNGLLTLDQRMEALTQALACDCETFSITCDGNTVIEANARVSGPLSFGTSTDNWVNSVPYSVDLEYEHETSGGMGVCVSGSPYVETTEETWTLEPLGDSSHYSFNLPTVGADANPYQYRLSHNLSAVGIPICNGSTAWQEARLWCLERAGFDAGHSVGSGSHNLGSLVDVSPFNHSRVATTNIEGGSYSLNETWVLIDSSGTGVAGRAIEDFTCNIQESEAEPFKTVNLEGTIQGLETVSYGTGLADGFSMLEDKYSAASGYWNNVSGRIYYRANLLSELNLNTIPLTKTVGHNPSRGIITYGYTYDTRPSHCFTGVGYDVKTEAVTVNDNNPTDIFANLTVLGRTCGPILQDINTKTAGTRQVQVDMLVSPATGCPTTTGLINSLFTPLPKSAVDTFVNNVYTDLTNQYGSVFKTTDNESWEYRSGRYSRTIAWTYSDCC
jgi:hypothetical protein